MNTAKELVNNSLNDINALNNNLSALQENIEAKNFFFFFFFKFKKSIVIAVVILIILPPFGNYIIKIFSKSLESQRLYALNFQSSEYTLISNNIL